MAMVLNTNMSALTAQRSLSSATASVNKTLERMSTGYKVNCAADDAAGMFIATNLDTQIKGGKVAQGNIATGTNLLKIAEGDLTVVSDNLLRMRGLAIQAANGVYSPESMKAMEDEVLYRAEELTRVAESSEFNGLKLLDGTGLPNGLRLQVGQNAPPAQNAMLVGAHVFADATADTMIGGGGSAAAVIASAFASASAAAAFIATVDEALKILNTRKAAIGAYQSRLESAAVSLTVNIENSTAAKSTIMDADIAEESSNYAKYQILQQTSATLLSQANQLPQLALQLIRG